MKTPARHRPALLTRGRLAAICGALVCVVGAPLAAQPPTAPLWTEGAGVRQADPSPFVRLVESVGPAVVSVVVGYTPGTGPSHLRDLGPGPGLAQGSGFVIHQDGYVLTNFHVIDNAASIHVRFSDHRELPARVVGVDQGTDLALLKLERTNGPLPVAPLGDSDALEVGDYVLAIGNPLGLHHSVSAGIVSALGRRNLPVEGRKQQGDFIQTDAPINPGNSGGPLVNMTGEVIGINTAINREGQGISFAIPINMVKTLLPQLRERGYVERSWLGVRVQALEPLLASSFSLENSEGALITEVVDPSPASRAALQEGDVITRFASHTIRNDDDLPWYVSTLAAESQVEIEVIRQGQPLTLEVTMEAIPNQDAPRLPDTPLEPLADPTSPTRFGVEVSALTTRLARQVQAPDDQGVLVTGMSDDSPARRGGLRHRDVIVEVDTTPIDSEESFRQAVESLHTGEVVRLKVLRRGRAFYLAFER
ncbi:peptidase [Lujinxingia litoralis]|uniref:Peptidase n=1 Tax=Lujinxingia litoralis TaxID=2211119 RepID=A0A328CDL7_9DELT|nr:trypsin-like peptidase domain-containing protein [Lujinxingia litoralis]RAL25511.1 peptidase [Lujinxingia litoralis]